MPPQQPPYGPAPTPPQQPSPQLPPQPLPDPSSPYDFIMNPQAPKRSPVGGNPKALLLLVGVVAVVALLSVVIFASMSGGSKNKQPFIKVAQEQQEMVRVADLKYDQLHRESTKNFAITTKATMTTDEAQLTDLLGRSGMKVNPKQLALGTDPSTDTKLEQAITTSRLDEALTAELQQELTTYRQSLAQAYASSNSVATRQLLKQLDNHAELLLAQSKQ